MKKIELIEDKMSYNDLLLEEVFSDDEKTEAIFRDWKQRWNMKSLRKLLELESQFK